MISSDTVSRPPHPYRLRRPALPLVPFLIAFFIVAVMLLPIVALAGRALSGEWGTLSHLLHTVLWRYLGSSIALAVFVSVGVAGIGTAAAWFTVMTRFPGRPLCIIGLVMPLAIPAYVSAYAYTDFLQFSGPVQMWLREVTGWQAGEYWFPEIRSLGGAASMFVLAFYPYVYLIATVAFMEQSVGPYEASRLLGCGPWRSFFKVALPLAKGAITCGVVLALMETLADYGTVSFFGVQSLTAGIFHSWYALNDFGSAALLALLLVGFIFVLILLENRYQTKIPQNCGGRTNRPITMKALRGWQAAGAFFCCFMPWFLGFLLPLGLLVRNSWHADFAFLDMSALTTRTFLLGVGSAFLSTTIALFLIILARIHPHPLLNVINKPARLGYAFPGAVIAIGIIGLMASLDRSLGAWLADILPLAGPVFFSGSVIALIYAYLVRYLPASLFAVERGFLKVPQAIDGAGRTLGAGPWRLAFRIHMPLVLSSLFIGIVLTFLDVIKELPATLILRPFNFDTLAVRIHHLASDERLAEAAAASLHMAGLSALPALIYGLSLFLYFQKKTQT